LVPCFYDKDTSLGQWVAKQRTLKGEGRIPEKRKELLDDIGFVWQVDVADESSRNQQQWEAIFDRLVEFKEANDHCRVPRTSSEDPELGRWAHSQRQYAIDQTIDPRRARRLDTIGFNWDRTPMEKRWNDKFERLKVYQREHGDCLVPADYEGDTELGGWVKRQRDNYRGKKLLPERKLQLDQIGFSWTTGTAAIEKTWTAEDTPRKRTRSSSSSLILPVLEGAARSRTRISPRRRGKLASMADSPSEETNPPHKPSAVSKSKKRKVTNEPGSRSKMMRTAHSSSSSSAAAAAKAKDVVNHSPSANQKRKIGSTRSALHRRSSKSDQAKLGSAVISNATTIKEAANAPPTVDDETSEAVVEQKDRKRLKRETKKVAPLAVEELQNEVVDKEEIKRLKKERKKLKKRADKKERKREEKAKLKQIPRA
jgi:Helicase associated domain